MDKCLYCGLDATVQDEYQGVPLLVCTEGHRTGVLPEEEVGQTLLKAEGF